MLNAIISGCGGFMGNVLTQLIEKDDEVKAVAGVDNTPPANKAYPVYSSFEDCTIDAQVIIDFSHPSALESLLKYALERKCALVLAATGYSNEQNDNILKASETVPIFQSGSMSLGINLMKKLLKQAASAIGADFDIEIIERHHNRKLDAPSGTALLLADAINEALPNKKTYNCSRSGADSKRDKDEIGIHAIRGGTIVGEHEIVFAGNDEIIELKHTSLSRNIFAVGALRAAKFIYDKTPGHYNMDDML